jgi:hypothetical protein
MLNDVVNYLVDDGDLERALAGVRSNLAPDGLVVFDSNTLALFRSNFASGRCTGMSRDGYNWDGLAAEARAGGTFEARLSGPSIETIRWPRCMRR